MKCNIPNCPELAEGDTNPPLCPMHFDLDLLLDFVQARGDEPSIEKVQEHFRRARSNSSFWTLTEAQIPELLPDFLAQKRPAAPTTEHAGLPTPVKE